ncbi:MAG: hypothetical protein ABIL44_10450 [candidate division WOR-3 bacterium]
MTNGILLPILIKSLSAFSMRSLQDLFKIAPQLVAGQGLVLRATGGTGAEKYSAEEHWFTNAHFGSRRL